ncbi:MAG: four helix bundle protein [Salinivirgaceae bacterium]|nr:four helix bundle protein [Salinivirgaceae bacterium]
MAKAIYVLSSKFSNSEKFGLASQIQRAAVSVSSNIAEGSGRNSPKEKIRFIEIAYGSLMETLSQLFIAKDLDYISDNDIAEIRPLIELISAQLSIWRNNINKDENKND